MLRFRTGHSLELTWFRYLPSRNISEPLWDRLREKIFTCLREEKMLQSWAGSLSQGKDLRRVPLDCLDAKDEPLFACPLFGPFYLSPKYSVNDMELLAALGVQTFSNEEFCYAVSLDLDSSSSRLKSDSSDNDWHTRTAEKLLAIAKTDLLRVQNLKCIPLQDGSWVSAKVGPIYFPDRFAISVPLDLGLRLVQNEALTNPARKALFSALGVKVCSPEIVNPRILGRYSTGAVDLRSSVSHLRWLYNFLPQDKRALDRYIPIFASDGVATYRVFVTLGRKLRVDDLYFETNDNFGVKELCRKRLSWVSGGRVIGHDVYFIHDAYLKAVTPATRVNGISWLKWLEESAGVRRVPRLVKAADPSKLSDLFSWLVSHRPEQVARTLHAHWLSYKDQIKPEIVNILRGTKVLWREPEAINLEDTWMPTKKLLTVCKDFDLVDKMPVLWLPMELNPDNQEGWKFLVQFGVEFEANMSFFLKILDILRCYSDSSPKSVPRNLLKAYEAIEKNSNSSVYDDIR